MYTVSDWVLIVCMSAFTLVAAYIDYRTQRIPNKLTVPLFLLGWVYQLYANGPHGLLYGLAGFAIGFGVYFVLWLIGGGGGGDAKLAGAVSVWLGFEKTLAMIIVSTFFVIIGTGFVLLWSMLTKGVYRTKNQMMPSTNTTGKTKKQLELLKFNKGRVGMTFALSLALATVVVTLAWPLREAGRAARQQRQQQQKESPEKSAPKSPAVPTDTSDPKAETGPKEENGLDQKTAPQTGTDLDENSTKTSEKPDTTPKNS